MGHGKLKKFAENETFRCLLQPDASQVLAAKEPGSKALRLCDHPIKGHWGAEMFGNDHPIVLELGCGKGDYTIALALRHPEINYIGVDIKGARLWKGAKYATENALPNVAFLRTRIEFIEAFFGPGEVSEIWLTFSDPQLRGSENSRLSSPLFLERYRKFLQPDGIIHLKTDSRYLYEYTQAVCQVNHLPILVEGTDIYKGGVYISKPSLRDPSLINISTFDKDGQVVHLADGLGVFVEVTGVGFQVNDAVGLEEFAVAFQEKGRGKTAVLTAAKLRV